MKNFINLLAMNWSKANIQEWRNAYINAHVDAGYYPEEIQDLAQNFKFHVDGRGHLVITRVREPSPEQTDMMLRRRMITKPALEAFEIYKVGFRWIGAAVPVIIRISVVTANGADGKNRYLTRIN